MVSISHGIIIYIYFVCKSVCLLPCFLPLQAQCSCMPAVVSLARPSRKERRYLLPIVTCSDTHPEEGVWNVHTVFFDTTAVGRRDCCSVIITIDTIIYFITGPGAYKFPAALVLSEKHLTFYTYRTSLYYR